MELNYYRIKDKYKLSTPYDTKTFLWIENCVIKNDIISELYCPLICFDCSKCTENKDKLPELNRLIRSILDDTKIDEVRSDLRMMIDSDYERSCSMYDSFIDEFMITIPTYESQSFTELFYSFLSHSIQCGTIRNYKLDRFNKGILNMMMNIIITYLAHVYTLKYKDTMELDNIIISFNNRYTTKYIKYYWFELDTSQTFDQISSYISSFYDDTSIELISILKDNFGNKDDTCLSKLSYPINIEKKETHDMIKDFFNTHLKFGLNSDKISSKVLSSMYREWSRKVIEKYKSIPDWNSKNQVSGRKLLLDYISEKLEIPKDKIDIRNRADIKFIVLKTV